MLKFTTCCMKSEFSKLTFLWNDATVSERISGISNNTSTRWQMIDWLALGVCSTRAWARILAFVVYASLVRRTIRVESTFWSTAFIRISNVVLDTLASTCTILFPTNGVSSARRWNAWRGSFLNWFFNLQSTLNEWIADKTLQTYAVWRVANNSTISV